MKAVQKIVILERQEKEIELGEKGDYLLIGQSCRNGTIDTSLVYRFGKLDGVRKRNYGRFGGKESDCITFKGQAYTLNQYLVMGAKLPKIVPNSRPIRVNLIESVATGIGDIVDHLKKEKNPLYHEHAELIMKIANEGSRR